MQSAPCPQGAYSLIVQTRYGAIGQRALRLHFSINRVAEVIREKDLEEGFLWGLPKLNLRREMTGLGLTDTGTAFSRALCENLLKQSSWEVPKKTKVVLPTAHVKHMLHIICLCELHRQIGLPFSLGRLLKSFLQMDICLLSLFFQNKQTNKNPSCHF